MAAIANGDTRRAVDIVNSCPDAVIKTKLSVPFSDGSYMCYADGATPLHLACLFGEPEVAKALLARNASPQVRDERGQTALSYAQRSNHEALQQLMEASFGRSMEKLQKPRELAERALGRAPPLMMRAKIVGL